MQHPHRFTLLLTTGLTLLLSLIPAFAAGPPYGLNTLPTYRPVSIGYLYSQRSATEMDEFVWPGFDVVVQAFAEPVDSDGSVGEGLENFLPNQAPLLAAAHARGKSVVMSIGGADPNGTRATEFNNIASDPTKRAHFCQAVVSYLQLHGYDGVDIDWEFPSASDGKANMTALMQDLYAAVKLASPNYIVMFGTGPGYWLGSYDFAALASVTDFYFYFGYDWTNTNPDYGIVVYQNGPMSNPGAGTQYTSAGDTLPEASVRGGIEYVLSKSFPAAKIICGLPFYGSLKDPWSAIRSTWAMNPAAYPVESNSLEAQINGEYFTTPDGIKKKMDAVLKPTTSVLPSTVILRGTGCWQIGHEDVAHPDLSTAFAGWLAAYSPNTRVITREAASGGGTQARLTFKTLPGGTYQVQYTNSLTAPVTWQTLGTMSPDAQGQLQIVDPAPLPRQRFYRVLYP